MRAVIDTNIFISGLLNTSGGAAKIINHFRKGVFELVISKDVFEEYVTVIHLFDNEIAHDKSDEILELVFERAIKVESLQAMNLCKDSDDEKFLTAALSGKAQYLVTKNRKDFPHNLKQVRIVNVSGFLKVVEKECNIDKL